MEDEQIAKLSALRGEIDETDDKIHDLLMHRAWLAEQIGAVKKESPDAKSVVRPAREIEIMRRLWNRHQGAFDRRVVMKIWREIICGCVNLQNPMTVAVHMPKSDCKNMDVAKLYFGSFTEYVPCKTESLVLKELTQGGANIGVFTLGTKDTCWWYAMAQQYKMSLSVFACLPLIENEPYAPVRPVYAVGKFRAEETGDDISLLFMQTDGTLSLSTLDFLLKTAGLETLTVCDTFSPDLSCKAYLFEVKGFVTKDDERLNEVMKKEAEKIQMLRVIGSCPAPLK